MKKGANLTVSPFLLYQQCLSANQNQLTYLVITTRWLEVPAAVSILIT